MSKRPSRRPRRVKFRTGADTPESVRQELVDEVRRRLETGELDSDIAMVETALAMLDGDRPL